MVIEVECPDCNGEGWVSGYGHDCGGNERECTYRCPVQTQEYCISCAGEGIVEVYEQQEDIQVK